jgi:uncharacterized protein DUF1552
MFLTQKHLSRREVLRSLGAAVALPYLDAMIPAGRSAARAAARSRLVCIEMVHGAAGSAPLGAAKHLWAPEGVGTSFDLSPTSLRSLIPFHDLLTIVSNTNVENADPFEAREIGGDHFRSSAVFLTQAHPKRTAGADVEAGTSLDQLYAQRFGRDTPLPSLQLSIERGDQGGGCGFGYSCAYVDTISWATPTTPLPMIRDPRVVFDELFGVFGPGASAEERRAGRATTRSILDWLGEAVTRVGRTLGTADKTRLAEYLDSIREIERRIQAVERRHGDGEPREIPDAPRAVPDSFAEHVRLMFDLQALAFASDITRVVSFKLGRDASNRVYADSGFTGAFHPASHHGEREAAILDFARLNTYHVGMLPYFVEKLRGIAEADGSVMDHTVILYGSPMGDSHMHTHKSVPFFLLGRAGGRLQGGRHLKAPAGTPLANVMLSLLQTLGLDDLEEFGDSTSPFSLTA